jgi:hypothetical protein
MVESVTPEGPVTTAAGTPRYPFPSAQPGTGAQGNEAQLRWGEALRGKVIVSMRMDAP